MFSVLRGCLLKSQSWLVCGYLIGFWCCFLRTSPLDPCAHVLSSLHASVPSHFSRVQLFVSLWTVARQAPEILWARILEWVAMPSSKWSSWLGYGTHIFCISWMGWQVFFFTTSITWEAPLSFLEESKTEQNNILELLGERGTRLIRLYINLFNKYLLNTCCGSDTVLIIAHIGVNISFHGACILGR